MHSENQVSDGWFLVLPGEEEGGCTIVSNNAAAIALMPLVTHPHTQAALVRSPVRGQEQEQPGVVPS